MEGHDENIRQGYENETWTCIDLDALNAENCWENNETTENGNTGVDNTHASSSPDQFSIRSKIGSIGAKAAHSKAQREKGLPHCRKYNTGRYLAEIWLQKETQPFA